jgi:hypothetical protein
MHIPVGAYDWAFSLLVRGAQTIMTHWNYCYAGLHIVSALPIFEWKVFEEDETACNADVRISLEDAPVSPNAHFSASWNALDDFQFSIPNTGVYRIKNGCEIAIAPMPSAHENEVRLFLLGSAWGALCCQRGILALHASVVQTRGGAVAFCGASGMGKSTLAAELIARGFAFVGDDLCCFDLAGGAPRVYHSAPRLKLWREALEKLGRDSHDLERDHFRADKFYREMTGIDKSDIKQPLPVRAIFILEWADLRLERLTGLNALNHLIQAATYRPEYIISAEQINAYWEQCAQVARGTQIWKLKRPKDWGTTEEHIALLEEHLGIF